MSAPVCTIGGVRETGRAPATTTEPAGARLDRPVLVSNLVSGALWLVPAALVSWPLSLVGAAFVAVGSVFLAAFYARGAFTPRQEALAWATPWLVAVTLWVVLLVGADVGTSASGVLLSMFAGLGIGTLAYAGWQVLALAIRQVLAWRSRTAARP